jgi:hypothetical protein
VFEGVVVCAACEVVEGAAEEGVSEDEGGLGDVEAWFCVVGVDGGVVPALDVEGDGELLVVAAEVFDAAGDVVALAGVATLEALPDEGSAETALLSARPRTFTESSQLACVMVRRARTDSSRS